jgi:hypothetical protein
MTELEAINRMLAAIGQAPVNSVDQSNPDVAICSRTLKQVSQEVQSEGWTFNKVLNYSFPPDIDEYIYIRPVNTDPSSDYILQMDLSHNTQFSRDKQAVARSKGSSVFLYDMLNNNFKWGTQPVEVDIIYYISTLSNIPPTAQNYIIDRASSLVSMQTVGDPNQFSILSNREQYSRAQLLEYETSQGDYTFFGHPKGSNYYNSYQPFHTLSR